MMALKLFQIRMSCHVSSDRVRRFVASQIGLARSGHKGLTHEEGKSRTIESCLIVINKTA